MSSNLKSEDFMSRFPPVLAQDEKMLALGKLISEELHISANLIERNVIYANIDSLSEKWLDVLAYDLHVDWYDYDYPIDIKRAVIKDSVKIHQKLGTKYAVETALKNVYKTAKVVEWFEYGAEPFSFKISVGVGNEGLNVNTSIEIEQKMKFYKNLRSHCDGVFYRLNGKTEAQAGAFVTMGAVLKVKAR